MNNFGFVKSSLEKIKEKKDYFVVAHKVLLVFTLIFLCLQLLYIPFFVYKPISKIEVQGLRELSESNIRSNIGVLERTSWLGVSVFQLAQQIVALPWVSNVVVQRCMPLCMRITVQEKKPIALLKTPTHFALLTKNYKIHTVSGNYAWDLPVIQLHKKTLSPVAYHFAIKQAASLIFLLHRSFPSMEKNVSEIIIDDPLNLKLILAYQGLPVYIGSEKYKEKIEKLIQILPYIQKQKKRFTYLDLRHPFGVVVQR